MNKERLLAAADLVEKGLPGVKFDMWIFYRKYKDNSGCGCVIGHMVFSEDPIFEAWRAKGFSAIAYNQGTSSNYFENAAHFFDVPRGVAERLCTPGGALPTDRKAIAARIRQYAETGELPLELRYAE